VGASASGGPGQCCFGSICLHFWILDQIVTSWNHLRLTYSSLSHKTVAACAVPCNCNNDDAESLLQPTVSAWRGGSGVQPIKWRQARSQLLRFGGDPGGKIFVFRCSKEFFWTLHNLGGHFRQMP